MLSEAKVVGGRCLAAWLRVTIANVRHPAYHAQTFHGRCGVTPTTAVVRVDMEKDAAGADYTDFHTLINIDGKWQIVAKVFHMYEG